MAQDPIQLDAIQIEASSGDTITISRGTNGDLEFVDAAVTGGISLSKLAGMSGSSKVLVVGATSEYTSIQDAIDDVPVTSSATNSYVILVTSGVYTESLTVEKDGISIVGIGNPSIVADAETDDALTLQAAVSTRPKTFSISGCKISCSADNSSCVRIIGGAGSTIGEDRILLKNLELTAQGIGSRPLRADTAGNIVAEGGAWSAVATTFVDISQCASLSLQGIRNLSAVSITFTTESAESGISAGGYVLQDLPLVGDVLINMTGDNTALISGCPNVGDVTIGGDRTARINSSVIGDLTLNNSAVAYVSNTEHGVLSGDGSAAISGISGSATFMNSASETVSFDVSQTDTQYFVCTEANISASPAVGGKTVDGFSLTFDAPQTGTVGWAILRSTK